MTLYAHPETGEVLESLDDFRAALRAVDEEMQPFWRTRRALRDAMTDRFDPPDMPDRVGRTATQEKVTQCPRCGTKFEETP